MTTSSGGDSRVDASFAMLLKLVVVNLGFEVTEKLPPDHLVSHPARSTFSTAAVARS
jgi:hypothetical protein